jgi:hypothetical protein
MVQSLTPRDLKDVETHLLDAGHFALETPGEEIGNRIEEFLNKRKLADGRRLTKCG